MRNTLAYDTVKLITAVFFIIRAIGAYLYYVPAGLFQRIIKNVYNYEMVKLIGHLKYWSGATFWNPHVDAEISRVQFLAG